MSTAETAEDARGLLRSKAIRGETISIVPLSLQGPADEVHMNLGMSAQDRKTASHLCPCPTSPLSCAAC